MGRRTRIYYTESQRALMWERWKAGWTLHQIGHLFDRPHTSVHNVLSRTGGIRPPERRRSSSTLSLSDREEISRSLASGESLRSIAARMRRAPSTVSREVKRNGGREGYRATPADGAAWERALRPKRCKLADNRALASLVADKLRLRWSPEQIDSQTVVKALIKNAGKLPQELYKSLTWDRGTEMHGHTTSAIPRVRHFGPFTGPAECNRATAKPEAA